MKYLHAKMTPLLSVVLLSGFVFGSMGALLSFPGHVHALTAPVLVDYGQSTWTDTTSTETTGSISWQTGDLIVVVGSAESGGVGPAGPALKLPTATGLTFATTTSVGYGSNTVTFNAVWTATAGSSGSGAVTSVQYGTGAMAGISAFVYRGSGGVGNSNTLSNSTATTISLTRGSANSAVVVVMGDWNAGNDTTVDASPLGGTQRVAAWLSSKATMFAFNWDDQGAAGTTSYGISNFGLTAAMSGAVVEITGAASDGLRPARTALHNSTTLEDAGVLISVTSSSFTPPNNSLLTVVAGVENRGTNGTITVSGGGLSWTKRLDTGPAYLSGPPGYYGVMQIWTAPVSTGASMTVTVDSTDTSYALDPARVAIQAIAYTNYNTSDPIGVSTTSQNAIDTGKTITFSSAPAATSEVLAARLRLDNGSINSTASPGLGWTEIYDQASSNGYGDMQMMVRTNSTSQNITWDDLSDNPSASSWLVWSGGLEIKVAAAAPPEGTARIIRLRGGVRLLGGVRLR